MACLRGCCSSPRAARGLSRPGRRGRLHARSIQASASSLLPKYPLHAPEPERSSHLAGHAWVPVSLATRTEEVLAVLLHSGIGDADDLARFSALQQHPQALDRVVRYPPATQQDQLEWL